MAKLDDGALLWPNKACTDLMVPSGKTCRVMKGV
jgi:hypothetical protein